MAEETREAESSSLKPAKKSRVWEIDFIRGVAILGMCVDHMIYMLSDLNGLFFNFKEVNNPFFNTLQSALSSYYSNPPYIRHYFHNLAFLFFMISGISCTFSHNNMKHAGKIFLATFVIDLATYLLFHISYAIDPKNYFDFRILFGVLFSLAIGTLLVALIQKIPHHKSIFLGLGLAILAYGFIMPFCYTLPMEHRMPTTGTQIWYDILQAYDTAPGGPMMTPAAAHNGFEAVIGLSVPHFFLAMAGLYRTGADYFQVLPWIGFTLIGAFLGETVYKDRKSLLPKLDGKWHRFFDWVGSKTLYIYVLHQPVNVLLIAAVCCPLGYRFF